MRFERAADRVAENTPTVIIHGTALIYWIDHMGKTSHVHVHAYYTCIYVCVPDMKIMSI